MSSNESKTGGSSLSKALMVLKEVCCSPTPLRFADLVERSELPKATAHRMLNTLAEEGLVRLVQTLAAMADQTYPEGDATAAGAPAAASHPATGRRKWR